MHSFWRTVDGKAPAAAAVVACLAMAGTAGADTEPRVPAGQTAEARQAIEDRLEAELLSLEARGDPNAEELIEPLVALGAFHEEEGNHFLARAAMERARELVRMHHGLYSLEQAALMRSLIENEQAIGNSEAAWIIEQDILALARRHPDDPRSVEILRDTAERRMDILDRYLAGEWPPEIYLGCYYHGGRRSNRYLASCGSGSSGALRRNIAREAQQLYWRAIRINLTNPELGSDELPQLRDELMESSYPYGNPGFARSVLRDVLTYQAMTSEPALQRADTLTQLGDWTLLHSRSGKVNETALVIYRRAHALLENAGEDSKAAQAFSPDLPVYLPAFTDNPLVTTPSPSSRGHIDLEIELTNYGRVDEISIVGSSEGVSRSDRRRLIRLLRRARFRPLMADGEFPASSTVPLRYHVD